MRGRQSDSPLVSVRLPAPSIGPQQHLALWLIIAVGAALRAWFLDTGGLYLDEANFLAISRLPTVSELMNFLRHHESHPPAYYLVARTWIRVFGDGDMAAASLSMVFGVALIPLTFAIAFRMTGAAITGLVAASLVAVSPTLVRYSVMARPYSLLAVLVLLATYWVWSLLLHRTNRIPSWFVALGVVMLYVHYWSGLVITGLTVVAVLRVVGDPQRRARLGILLAANLAMLVLFVPQLPTFLEQLSVAGHRITVASLWSRFEPVSMVLSGFFLKELLMLFALVAILVILRWRLKAPIQANDAEALFMSLGTVIAVLTLAIVLSPLSLLLVAQCFAMLTPLLLLGAATGLQPGQRPARAAAFLVYVVLIGSSLSRIVEVHRFVRSNGREVAALLSRSSTATDLVLVLPAYAAPEIRRYGTAAGEIHAYADGGFPAAAEFDHRIARDESVTALQTALGMVNSTAERGGRVWYLTWKTIPLHLRPADDSLRASLTRRFGPPVLTTMGTERPVLYNGVRAVLHEALDSTTTAR